MPELAVYRTGTVAGYRTDMGDVLANSPAVPSKVLVVEDDPGVGSGLAGILAADGHEVRWAHTAADAHRLIADRVPDLILLDLGLPDADGLELCGKIREQNADVVVVVVTARTDETDAVRALDGGADDFVTKPFRQVELRARLRAHLRRRGEAGPPELHAGPVRLDQGARRAWVGEREITLRPKEHELLAVLVASAGEAVRREHLMDVVWDQHWCGSTKTLDVHVASVRRKLADAGDRWDRIATLRGYGYRFELD
ncbi:response regulator transcription factor [Krasilnikovia sp. MM14-A1259]